MRQASILAAGLVAIALTWLPQGRAEEAAAEITGAGEASDGDTLDLGYLRIRLWGVDAPELAQTCARADGAEWDCGRAAAARLKQLMRGAELRCTARDRDQYGRVVARCSARGLDLGQRLIAEGLAWAYTRYTLDYAEDEAQARAAGVGLWQGSAQPPWEYRAGSRFAASSGSAPAGPDAGCVIKGNINAAGERIFHTPASRWYARTSINEMRGQRWFCDEDEALAAGWRPASGQ